MYFVYSLCIVCVYIVYLMYHFNTQDTHKLFTKYSQYNSVTVTEYNVMPRLNHQRVKVSIEGYHEYPGGTQDKKTV